jgi:pimeloyl-ACP methyl ester carboxylesterase/DNA-binding CsgD family transcriptional regulator
MPMAARKPLRQQIRYVKAADGTRLAWAQAGEGPVVVKAANWLTHLEYEWESPVWQHWLQFFAGNFRFVRYDERGCGMSEWRDTALTARIWTDDLEAVIDAAEPKEPVTLLGISQGSVASIGYALRHPERVARLILYGGYARGPFKRGNPEGEATFRAVIELARVAWASDNPSFRQVFTSRFIPGATPEQLAWFNDLCLKTTPGEVAAKLLSSRATIDIESQLAELRVPTLVLHARDDGVVPVSEGRLLASAIPGAEFIELDSRNHILLEEEPAWRRFQEAVLDWMQPGQPPRAGVFGSLSDREREVLALMGDGLSNADIAARLAISDKTVRNHASNIFDKLGVWSRAQAIVFARDRGFRG